MYLLSNSSVCLLQFFHGNPGGIISNDRCIIFANTKNSQGKQTELLEDQYNQLKKLILNRNQIFDDKNEEHMRKLNRVKNQQRTLKHLFKDKMNELMKRQDAMKVTLLDDIKDTPHDPSMALIRQLVTEYLIFPLGSEIVRAKFPEVINESRQDHEENGDADEEDEREEGMHDADDDVEEESQSLQCGCQHCCQKAVVQAEINVYHEAKRKRQHQEETEGS